MCSTVQRYEIYKVNLLYRYNPGTYLNDIALLQMNSPVDTTKTPHITPACLPKDTYKFKDDQKCYIVGWGDDVYKVGIFFFYSYHHADNKA